MHMFTQGEELLRRPRHRRRPGVARHRPRLRQPLPRQRSRLADLFRRRRGQPGPGLRELQHGGAVEAAGDLRHREQPLRHGHVGRRAPRRRPISPSAASPSTSRASRSTAWTSAPSRPPATRRSRMVPRRQGPVHPRDADLPLSRPLDVRPGQVPHQGGGPEDARRSTTRSSRSAAACSSSQGQRGGAEERSTPRCARSSTKRPNSPSTIPSPIRPSSGPTSTASSTDAQNRIRMTGFRRSACARTEGDFGS